MLSNEYEIFKTLNNERKEESKDPIEFIETLRRKYGFENIDISLLLTAYGNAYGFEWLEKYYQKHESELIDRI